MRAKLLSLLKDSAQVYSAQAFGVLVSFGISILVARHLGPEGRGAYGWIMALNILAIQFGQLGTDTLNRRLAATKPSLAPALAGNSFFQSAILGLLAALALYVYGLTQPMGQLYPFALLIGLLAVPFNILYSTWSSLGVGLGHAKVLAQGEFTQRAVTIGLIGFAFLFTTLQVWHLTVAVLIGMACTAALTGYHLNYFLKGKWAANPMLFKYEKNFIITAFGSGLCFQLLQRIDILMLAAFRPLEETGHFAIAQTLLDAILMLPGALAFMLLPKMAAEAEHASRTKFLLIVLGGTLTATAVISLIAGLFAPFFIPLLFGDGFAETIPIFQRLLIAGLMLTGYNLCQNAVAGTRRARHVIIAPLVGVALKASIGYLIIPHGMLAAANASILAYAGAFATALYLALRK